MPLADEELIREVRHAAGNLVQRMQYLTLLIEDEAPGERAAESLASLRLSLDCLHRLIVRSLDLVRATETRPLAMSLGDITSAFVLRFGAGADAILADERFAVLVDPLVLERALALLTEVLVSADDATNGRAPLAVAVDRRREQSTATISLRAAWRAFERDPFARVHARVAVALALKLLTTCRFETDVDESDDGVALRIVVPLHDGTQRDDASVHRTSARDSRDLLPL